MANLKLTQTPPSQPERIDSYLNKFPRPANTHATENPSIRRMDEPTFNAKMADLADEQRGVKYAAAQVGLATEYVKLDTTRVKLGTAKMAHLVAEQGLRKTAFDLVKARAETAIAHDNATAKVNEHGLNQGILIEQAQAKEIALTDLRLANKSAGAALPAVNVPRLKLVS